VADAHRAESERRAMQILDSARREATQIIDDATSKGNRQRGEVEREQANLVRRRDSVQAQLQNVREILETMTGATFSPGDVEMPEQRV
jgi:F0F1-type ATP synthase membrane subunit b/b'